MFCLLLLILPVTECALQPHVVDGSKAPINKFPYSVFLLIGVNGAVICGGSILNQRLILTAAQCFEGVKIETDIIPYAGSARKLVGKEYTTLRYAIHGAFFEHTMANDIALVLLEKSLHLGEDMQRIAVYRIPPVRTFAVVAGWGYINEVTGEQTEWLRKTRQKIWTYQECRKVVTGIPKGSLCGGDLQNTGYPSIGDSGSALVVDKYIQIGLVSFKRPQVTKSLVAYTNISYHYNWVVSTARKLYCKKKKQTTIWEPWMDGWERSRSNQ
ncbi:serine protease 52-like [Leptidea sinapis]|uniref:serine protease 52-like n=1 Tax=Leptidea sinapis TaxID=189913 RepID=UPI00212249BA|nr:serine protease 52-like [Leptidea sinapis]